MGQEHVAQYLLNVLNARGMEQRYMLDFGLQEPCYDWDELCEHMWGRIKPPNAKGPGMDPNYVAHCFLSRFRNGSFGRVTLDDVPRYIEATCRKTRAALMEERWGPAEGREALPGGGRAAVTRPDAGRAMVISYPRRDGIPAPDPS